MTIRKIRSDMLKFMTSYDKYQINICITCLLVHKWDPNAVRPDRCISWNLPLTLTLPC